MARTASEKYISRSMAVLAASAVADRSSSCAEAYRRRVRGDARAAPDGRAGQDVDDPHDEAGEVGARDTPAASPMPTPTAPSSVPSPW